MQSNEMLYTLTNGFHTTDPMPQVQMVENEIDSELMAEFHCNTAEECFDFLLSTKAIQLFDAEFWKQENADYHRDLY